MKFSRKTDYGIILLQSLRHTYESGEYIPLSRIATRERLPSSFLEKLAEVLRKGGYLRARRGAEGGYRLVKDPRRVSVKELIDIFEEPEMMRCMKSPHPEKYCPLVSSCPSRAGWLKIEKEVNAILSSVTIDAL